MLSDGFIAAMRSANVVLSEGRRSVNTACARLGWLAGGGTARLADADSDADLALALAPAPALAVDPSRDPDTNLIAGAEVGVDGNAAMAPSAGDVRGNTACGNCDGVEGNRARGRAAGCDDRCDDIATAS